jgi:dTDP-4-dehydrorhamnose 3,5-epimerase-like enzyme
LEAPRLIAGRLAVDDRGEVGFVNDFDFAGVKRFYTVANHRKGFVRAWHGHKREGKYVTVVSGAMLVCIVAPDDWAAPSRDLAVERHVLSARTPAVLYIPGGHAHGTMSLTDEARAVFFSTAGLAESQADDFRFPARTWDPWSVTER